MAISEKESEDSYSDDSVESNSNAEINLNKNENEENSKLKLNKSPEIPKLNLNKIAEMSSENDLNKNVEKNFLNIKLDKNEDEEEDEDLKSNSSGSCSSSSMEDAENMEFANKVCILKSDSTKSTEKSKKNANFYKGFMRKPSRSIDEDCTVNQLSKKSNEYFSKSPNKKALFRARTFNDKENNNNININNNISTSINISNNEFVNKVPVKRRFSLLMLGEEKTKVPSRRASVFEIKRIPIVNEKPARYDTNGTEICKKNKRKVKISFAFPFENVVEIESFKGLNYVGGLPKEYVPQQQKTNCQCCNIY